MSILAIDFDGVLHDGKPPKGKRMGKPIIGAKETMVRWVGEDHEVIVFTARGEHTHVVDWLDYFDIPHTRVTNIKPNADVYLDDRAVRFTNWTDSRIEVEHALRQAL